MPDPAVERTGRFKVSASLIGRRGPPGRLDVFGMATQSLSAN